MVDGRGGPSKGHENSNTGHEVSAGFRSGHSGEFSSSEEADFKRAWSTGESDLPGRLPCSSQRFAAHDQRCIVALLAHRTRATWWEQSTLCVPTIVSAIFDQPFGRIRLGPNKCIALLLFFSRFPSLFIHLWLTGPKPSHPEILYLAQTPTYPQYISSCTVMYWIITNSTFGWH